MTVSETPHLVITPPKGWVSFDLDGLWNYRELLFFLAWRDVQIRYKQTVLGVAWAVLQPLLTMLIFTLFFGKVAKIPSDGYPYAVFAYAGLLPWTFFANAITNSGNSLVQNSQLISKVYFPRLIMPASPVVAGLMDFAISLVILFILFFFYGVHLTVNLLALPALTLLTTLLATGVGTFFAGLNVKYRDIRHALPFIVQLMMFATPIIYPMSMVPQKYQWVLALNPMAGIVEGFRACLLGGQFDLFSLTRSLLITLVVLTGSVMYFRSVERHFADIV